MYKAAPWTRVVEIYMEHDNAHSEEEEAGTTCADIIVNQTARVEEIAARADEKSEKIQADWSCLEPTDPPSPRAISLCSLQGRANGESSRADCSPRHPNRCLSCCSRVQLEECCSRVQLVSILLHRGTQAVRTLSLRAEGILSSFQNPSQKRREEENSRADHQGVSPSRFPDFLPKMARRGTPEAIVGILRTSADTPSLRAGCQHCPYETFSVM